MNYKIISSCSTGNATIIKDIILIDCGVTFKKLEKYYKQLKIEGKAKIRFSLLFLMLGNRQTAI